MPLIPTTGCVTCDDFALLVRAAHADGRPDQAESNQDAWNLHSALDHEQDDSGA